MAEMKRKYTHYKETDDSKIRFEENGRKIIFLNPNRELYERVRVDGVEITSGERCDYMLAKYDYAPQGEPFVNPEGSNEEYFVELKGSSIIKAVSQLETTITSLSVNPKGMDKFAFIIGTRVSPKIDTERQIAIKNFSKQYKTKLVIKEKEYSHPLPSALKLHL